MAKPDKVDPISLLEATDRTRSRDTLRLALAQMDDDERAVWEQVLNGETKNPRNGQQYAVEHVVRALREAGYMVSPAAVLKWRKNL